MINFIKSHAKTIIIVAVVAVGAFFGYKHFFKNAA